MQARSGENAAVVLLDSAAEVDAAVRQLADSGFNLCNVSLAARDVHRSGEVAGYYFGGGRMNYWGREGEYWGDIWGALAGWALFALPEIGPVIIAGPLAGWMIAGLENAALFGGLTAVGAGLYNIGIGREQIAQYERALRAGKFLLLVHGAAGEVSRGRQALGAVSAADGRE